MNLLNFNSLQKAFLGWLFSCVLCSLALIFFGESPLLLWQSLYNSIFTPYGLGYTLFYTTSLMFTGLSVAVAFQAGLFNIGAEGQLYIGSLFLLATSLYFPHAFPAFACILAILACAIGGGLWGGIAGYLKAKRSSHEVIVTILLNFIAYSITTYFILHVLKNPESQNPESLPISSQYHFALASQFFSFFKTTPLNLSFLVALLVCFLSYVLLYKTPLGYEWRAVGLNPEASRFAGISHKKYAVLSFILAGALAGFVSLNDILGHHHKIIQSFSPEYGFIGIAVALVGRNHPLGVIPSAFLFGVLHNSAREIEFLSENLTKEYAVIIQAVIIMFVASPVLFEKTYHLIRGQKWKS